jgi:hypothetical protein
MTQLSIRSYVSATAAAGIAASRTRWQSSFPARGAGRGSAPISTFRDLAGPVLQGSAVVRVANPEEDPEIGLERFRACLAIAAT